MTSLFGRLRKRKPQPSYSSPSSSSYPVFTAAFMDSGSSYDSSSSSSDSSSSCDGGGGGGGE